jgi:hypothetical protein
MSNAKGGLDHWTTNIAQLIDSMSLREAAFFTKSPSRRAADLAIAIADGKVSPALLRLLCSDKIVVATAAVGKACINAESVQLFAVFMRFCTKPWEVGEALIDRACERNKQMLQSNRSIRALLMTLPRNGISVSDVLKRCPEIKLSLSRQWYAHYDIRFCKCDEHPKGLAAIVDGFCTKWKSLMKKQQSAMRTVATMVEIWVKMCCQKSRHAGLRNFAKFCVPKLTKMPALPLAGGVAASFLTLFLRARPKARVNVPRVFSTKAERGDPCTASMYAYTHGVMRASLSETNFHAIARIAIQTVSLNSVASLLSVCKLPSAAMDRLARAVVTRRVATDREITSKELRALRTMEILVALCSKHVGLTGTGASGMVAPTEVLSYLVQCELVPMQFAVAFLKSGNMRPVKLPRTGCIGVFMTEIEASEEKAKDGPLTRFNKRLVCGRARLFCKNRWTSMQQRKQWMIFLWCVSYQQQQCLPLHVAMLVVHCASVDTQMLPVTEPLPLSLFADFVY